MSKINKKYKNIKLFVLIAFILLLTSCAEQRDENIQIWYYEYEAPDGYTVVVEKAVEYIEKFAEINEIEIEAVNYSYRDLSHND